MLRRELAIALRSRLTWLQAALAALLVGHGFVLAVDLYSAGSRSVHQSALMAREFDPLLGIVRPTLGGLYLSLSLLGPLVAARMLALEKERGSLHALLLQTGSPVRVLGAKFLAANAAVGLQLVAPLCLLVVWQSLGGHLDWSETSVPLLAYMLYLSLIAALALMAAAWTATLAQAVTLALLLVITSWAIDASEGFAALAWLGRALDWSVTTHLVPFEHATLGVGAVAWIAALVAGSMSYAWLGLRRDLSWIQLGCAALAILLATAAVCVVAQADGRAWDLSEYARASLPPAVIRELRALPGPLAIDVWLDRDDARRRQFEIDALAKLRLARPDLNVRAPLDERSTPSEADRAAGYGRIVVHVGQRTRETYSTSRRELATLMFELAGRPTPSFAQHEYPGYPLSVDAERRAYLMVCAYVGLPLALLVAGWFFTRPSRRIP